MPRRQLAPASDARALALEVLVRVATADAFADVLLAHRLARAALPRREQALATRLVYGTLAWQGRLDHHLTALVDRPLAKLDPHVLAVLRLGLYQLLFLSRVPVYAAVDSCVRLARGMDRGAAGLVNAVLRRAARERQSLPLPDATADPITRLAIEWSHPRWLVERWASTLSTTELVALLRANNEATGTVLRTNTLRTTVTALRTELEREGVSVSSAPFAPEALVVAEGAARLRTHPAWHEGHFAFQGEASQLVTYLLDPRPGDRALDVCAAPGGKALHLAERVGTQGIVLALDLRRSALIEARREAQRLGTPWLAVAVADGCTPPARGIFDRVLVDAPCSGLGTLRRHPELRWRRRPDDITRLATRQAEILAGVAPCVRPSGVLVYAVCTLTHEENEGVVEQFLARHPRFAIDEAASFLPAPAAGAVTEGPYLRTFPHRHGLDGFFAVRLRARS